MKQLIPSRIYFWLITVLIAVFFILLGIHYQKQLDDIDYKLHNISAYKMPISRVTSYILTEGILLALNLKSLTL